MLGAGSSARRLRGAGIESAKELLAKTGAGGATDREQLAIHLRAMASLLRDVELLATGADVARWPTPTSGRRSSGSRASTRASAACSAFAAVDEALAALERNAGVKIVADWLVLQL